MKTLPPGRRKGVIWTLLIGLVILVHIAATAYRDAPPIPGDVVFIASGVVSMVIATCLAYRQVRAGAKCNVAKTPGSFADPKGGTAPFGQGRIR